MDAFAKAMGILALVCFHFNSKAIKWGIQKMIITSID
jgi:hypothetical protein